MVDWLDCLVSGWTGPASHETWPLLIQSMETLRENLGFAFQYDNYKTKRILGRLRLLQETILNSFWNE